MIQSAPRLQSIVVAIETLGCEVVTQQADDGVNKPFKCGLRKEWEKWIFTQGLQTGTTSPPTRRQIAE